MNDLEKQDLTLMQGKLRNLAEAKSQMRLLRQSDMTRNSKYRDYHATYNHLWRALISYMQLY